MVVAEKSGGMGSSPKPVEQVVLEVVAYHDPIDYHRLRRLVGERLSGGYSTGRHRTALSNLRELDLIVKPGVAHEYIHITAEGWANLGGETSRYESNVGSVDAAECSVCKRDELIESRW